MIKSLGAIAAVVTLGWVCSAPAQQTLLGTCSGQVGVQTAPGSTLGNVYCTPAIAPPPSGNCGLILGGAPIFCEPFDVVNTGTPGRTGALDPNVWGVSRTTGNTNFNQGLYNGWTTATNISLCDGTTPTVAPPNDVQICNGQLREATNDNPSGAFDNGNVLTLAMYPKQPFDFAGRTGTVSFDVSNDTTGTHSAWPEFWMSDLPVPAPFNHFDSWQALPANGFGIRFANMVGPGGVGECPNRNNLDKPRWTVDSAVVVRNYVMDDTNGLGGVRTNMTVTGIDCVISSSGPGDMNHIELLISQGGIDVYATDAGVTASPTTLRKIATITNANLTLTRGLVWLEDAHYNADKGIRTDWPVPSQRNHTFSWDNLAFDGPFTYRDFSYDAPDALVPDVATNTTDLGKLSFPGQGSSWNVDGLPANPQATAVRVLFNFFNQVAPIPTAINVIVNGHVHSVGWPYPDMIQNTWRTFAVTVPITDLVAGTNVVLIGSDSTQITSNVNIVLVDVPGGVPVLPGNSRAYPK